MNRQTLWTLVVLQTLCLVALGAVATLDPEILRGRPPTPRVIAPPVLDAEMGEYVRYRLDDSSGKLLGFMSYHVIKAEVIQGFPGQRFLAVEQRLQAPSGLKDKTRIYQLVAHAEGTLPPDFDHERTHPGGLPVPHTYATEDVEFEGRRVRGFRLDAVRPRASLTHIGDRFWFTERVPVFGLLRWERDDQVWTLVEHAWQKPHPRMPVRVGRGQ